MREGLQTRETARERDWERTETDKERDWERDCKREGLREKETAREQRLPKRERGRERKSGWEERERKTTMGRKTALAREMEEQTNLSDLGQQLHICGNISSISSQVTDTLHSAKYHT